MHLRHLSPVVAARSVGAAAVAGAVVLLGAGCPSADAAPRAATGCMLHAIGIPGDTVQGVAGAGAVEVRSSCTASAQLITLPTVHGNDRFGASLSATYLDADDNQDLVVGIPGYDDGSATDAGAIAVFRGSSTGVAFDGLFTQSSSGVPGTAQAGARFGAAVAASRDVDIDRVTVLVGEPGKDVGAATDAGGFDTLIFFAAALRGDESSETTLDSPGIPGTPARGDLLGSAVSFHFGKPMVGAPGKAVAGYEGAGAVLDDTTLLTQDTACMPGTAETGDHFGAALAGGWIGVPGEDLGSATDAGMVEQHIAPTGGECLGLNQDVPGISGAAESGDRFGAALVDLHIEQDGYERIALLVGVPGEDTGTHADSGFVDIVAENFGAAKPADWVRGAGSTAGPNATGAAYGTAFGNTPSDDLGQVDISGPGGGVVYRVKYAAGHPLQHLATYRPTTTVPAGTYGAALAGIDF